ncbi:MAG: DNA polymerase III subunit gamma/tau, partial [Candidatus Pelagibacter sp.]
AKIFLNDMLEIIYLFSRRVNLGSIEKDMSISEAEAELINKNSKNLDIQDLGLFWQITMKNLDDLRIIGNENLILEMYIMQLVHVKSLDVKSENSNYSEIIESSKSQKKLVGKDTKEQNLDADFSSQVKNQLKNTDQVKTKPIKSLSSEIKKTSVEITNFQDLINLATRDKEIELRFDLERNVKLVSFSRGKIDISFNEKLNKDFIKNLTEKLLLWTGERWIISLSKNSEAKSVYEQNLQNRSNKLDEYEKSKTAKQLKDAFPDAELINIDEEDND